MADSDSGKKCQHCVDPGWTGWRQPAKWFALLPSGLAGLRLAGKRTEPHVSTCSAYIHRLLAITTLVSTPWSPPYHCCTISCTQSPARAARSRQATQSWTCWWRCSVACCWRPARWARCGATTNVGLLRTVPHLLSTRLLMQRPPLACHFAGVCGPGPLPARPWHRPQPHNVSALHSKEPVYHHSLHHRAWFTRLYLLLPPSLPAVPAWMASRAQPQAVLPPSAPPSTFRGP